MAELSDRWTEAQKRIYGRVFRFMQANPKAQCHPDTAPLPDNEWETICHNAAWLAAEFLEEGELKIVDSETGDVVAETNRQALH